MALPATMSKDDEKNDKGSDDDEHEHDMLMPGFRFHPTEEELVVFYLRRKVEGKRFNAELITFLDLYRYDPWELPALATIGEKEWYFYVPRDRKYRNGDRPNRVTTSGYWKATGADRMIRGENSQPIGLKKTLVFHSGKAPRGIRTNWMMNEYRLPHHGTEPYQKAEISLCRVYKRAGVEDYSNPNSCHLPRLLPTTRASSSFKSSTWDQDINKHQKQATVQQHHTVNSNLDAVKGFQPLLSPPPHNHRVIDQVKAAKTNRRSHHGGSSSSSVTPGLIPQHLPVNPNHRSTDGDDYENFHRPAAIIAPAGVPPLVEARERLAPPMAAFSYQQQVPYSYAAAASAACGSSSSSSSSVSSTSSVLQDDLHRLVDYYTTHHHPSSHQFSALLMPHQLQPQPQQLVVSSSNRTLQTAAIFSERVMWDWNPAVPNQDYNPHHPTNNPFK